MLPAPPSIFWIQHQRSGIYDSKRGTSSASKDSYQMLLRNKLPTTSADVKADQLRFNMMYGDCDIVFVPLDFSVASSRIRKKIEQIAHESEAIADFGCGHGGTLFMLSQLNPKARMYGLDYSEVAIRKARMLCRPGGNLSFEHIDFGTADAKKFVPEEVDFAYTNQVIEHVVDEQEFLNAIVRCSKPNAHVYVGTVLKKSYAWYFYRNSNGDRVLEPTHVREYTDVGQLFKAMEAAGLSILDYDLSIFKFPLIDIPLKLLSKYAHGPRIFAALNSPTTMWLRRLTAIPIPGYYIFQVLARKNPR